MFWIILNHEDWCRNWLLRMKKLWMMGSLETEGKVEWKCKRQLCNLAHDPHIAFSLSSFLLSKLLGLHYLLIIYRFSFGEKTSWFCLIKQFWKISIITLVFNILSSYKIDISLLKLIRSFKLHHFSDLWIISLLMSFCMFLIDHLASRVLEC